MCTGTLRARAVPSLRLLSAEVVRAPSHLTAPPPEVVKVHKDFRSWGIADIHGVSQCFADPWVRISLDFSDVDEMNVIGIDSAKRSGR